LDGKFFARETASIQGGQESVIRFPIVFEKAGSHYVTARIKHDVLSYDNSMSSGVDVLTHLNVLILRDPDKKKMLDSVWGALEVANRLVELKDDDDESVYTKAPVAFSLHDKIGLPDLSDVDVVLLDGGRTVTAELSNHLSHYVRNGGGLLLMADNKIAVDVWNHEMGSLLPVAIKRLQVLPIGEDRFQQLSKDSFTEGALMPFYKMQDGDVDQSKFYTWFQTDKLDKQTRVLARFKNKDPFIIEKRQERGNVVLCTAGLNGQGNNLIVREFFLPLLYRLISQVSNGGIYPRTLKTNEAVSLHIDLVDGLRAVTFNLEGDEPQTLKVGNKISVTDGAARSGLGSFLLVHKNSNERIWVGVQGERMDSDLRPLAEAQLTELSNNDVRIVSTWEELNNVLQTDQAGKEWHPWFILLLLLAITGEMIMQRRFV
ncbi:MAG: hypothetical protein MJH11_11265, partial [Lentisphaeria bacterium]|nr:hypothetical protein [Lentisphaeria bacterium]